MSEALSGAVWRSVKAGFLHGAVLYGAVVSLLHVVHNRLPSVADSLILLLVTGLVYGVIAALAFGGGAVASRFVERWVPALRPGPDGVRPLVGPFFVFTLGFWFFYFNYALSYDRLPFFKDPDVRHMLVYLAFRTLLVVAGAWLVARLFAAVHARLPAVGRAGVAGASLGGLLVAHVALALFYDPPAPPSLNLEDVPQVSSAESGKGQKVVLLGIDGAEWHVIEGLFEQGELPHLRSFVAEGSTGRLATLEDANSPLIWASIYSGHRPEQHRVHDFYTLRFPGMSRPGIFPVHRTYFKELVGFLEQVGFAERTTVDRSNLRSVLLWEAAHSMGRSLGLVDGYYYSFPVPELGESEGFYFAYGANDYLARVDAADRDAALDGLFARPASLLDERRETLGGKDFEWQSETLLSMLDEGEQPEFVNLYTHEPDSSQHRYWKWYEPRYFLGASQEDIESKGSVIPDLYRKFDHFLGRLLERIDEDTVVMIISDHGHVPCILHQRMYTWHRHGPPGVLLMRGGPVRRGHQIEEAHVLDVFPTVLHLLGLPVPEDGAGRVLSEVLDGSTGAVETVPSYDFLRSRFEVQRNQSSSARNEDELERLKNLGYI
jgi:hypothetical protein